MYFDKQNQDNFTGKAEKPVDPARVRVMRDQLLDACQQAGITQESTWDLVSITDEIFANIAEHSSARWIRWQLLLNQPARKATIQFEDDGEAFDASTLLRKFRGMDPLEHLSNQRHLGLSLVAQLVEDSVYTREGDTNKLLLHKSLN